MGVVANTCRSSRVPAMKSKAEALAVKTQESLVEVYLGAIEFDRAGEYYFAGDKMKAIAAVKEGFKKLKHAKNLLINVQHKELEMHPHNTKKFDTKYEEIMYDEKEMEEIFRVRVRGIQNVIQCIDHLTYVNAEEKAVEALENNDFNSLYNSVSNSARELITAALQHNMNVIKQSKYTHETSDVIKLLFPEEANSVAN
ncbi:hypothetical protein P9D36_03500 [Bacillus haynesii]|uniref:hypothetical protein n=1 Tax=Bacillus haynesii TaxID=1925021 RepID=UPI0022827286|nr:hypothetical protein [Bacillus haynesii]MCY7816281.1 hypothetical protein [Bacillus haynesii]MCY8223223.1 hypothetical protein [Bacillus haynesii]MCY8660997.1 hypothetical protein [Bacillus haynesii]MEC1446446.1 hypothetical protein [Bacillus haynesii]MEC1473351.1 hypothetical protein [Bacillus haynesii]